MYFTGFSDEAAPGLEGQIKATLALGWKHIESRCIDGKNIHDLSAKEFDRAAGRLEEAGIRVNCFGSAIANWSKKITDPFDSSLQEARRAIPRMKRLGTRLVRIMSFAVCEDRDPEDQMEGERFKRLRELVRIFSGEGIIPVHENCMNYGGMAWRYTLRMLENVPGLRLVFDTGNPTFNPDRSRPKPWPRQSGWEFYSHVRDFVEYIHIKDTIWDKRKNEPVYTMPGEGQGEVRRILADMFARGYDGGISIEPHLAVVFHDKSVESSEEIMFHKYVEYGKRTMALVDEIKQSGALKTGTG